MTDLLDEDYLATLASKEIITVSSNHYLAAATSDNTRRAYQSDISHYEKSGGRLPAHPEHVLTYLKQQAERLNPRSLSRKLTAIKNWHTYQGFPDPTTHPLIKKTMIGILRVHGKPKEKARPMLPEHLLIIANYLESHPHIKNLRDNALLQIGFFGALRRSELVAIRYEHIKWESQGIDILLPQSKTDQIHEGQYLAIPFGKGKLCAVTALKKWLDAAGIHSGPIFRRIYYNQEIGDKALTPLTVNQVIKQRARDAGLEQAEEYSGHSLRRGLATAASKKGASVAAIMRQGRWKNVNTVMEYIEAASRFEDNVAAFILE